MVGPEVGPGVGLEVGPEVGPGATTSAGSKPTRVADVIAGIGRICPFTASTDDGDGGPTSTTVFPAPLCAASLEPLRNAAFIDR